MNEQGMPVSLELAVGSVLACIFERPRHPLRFLACSRNGHPLSQGDARMLAECLEVDELAEYAQSPSFLVHVQETVRAAVQPGCDDFARGGCCAGTIALVTEDILQVFQNITRGRMQLHREGAELGSLEERDESVVAVIRGALASHEFPELLASLRAIARKQLVPEFVPCGATVH